MKAVLCRAFGPVENLSLESFSAPMASDGELIVRVAACGINFFDGLAVRGEYQTKPDFPFSPGGEVAGEVVSVGGGSTEFNVGDRVMAFIGFGGYAEQAVVPVRSAVRIPDSMSFDDAAGFVIAYATSHHALKDRGQLKPGETLLVLGAAGGVGLTAVELGKVMGARVIAAASSDDKLKLAQDYGADDVVNYSDGDLREKVKALTSGRGVDVIYDPVGGKLAAPALRSIAPFGRYLVIGFASGDIPTVAYNQLLLRQAALVGVFWGNFSKDDPDRSTQDLAELLDWYSHGKLRPHISETYPLDEFQTALGRVMSRQAKGKVLIRPNGGMA